MTVTAIAPERRNAARIVGFLYRLTMATSMFGEIYVRDRLIVRGDAVATARNLASSPTLFRLSIAGDLLTSSG